MAEHTPGPWFHDGYSGGKHYIRAGDPNYQSVADVRFTWRDDRKESAANADLIAAAPEMYEALKAGHTGAIFNGPELLERVADFVDDMGRYTALSGPLREKAKLERAAIAKAEGKEE